MRIEIHVGQRDKNYDFFIEIPKNTDTIQATTIQQGMQNLKILENQEFEVVIENEKEIKKIGGNAFSGYEQLKAVTIQDNIIKIGREAFKDCIGLEVINSLENVTEIGDYAFSGCKSLTWGHSPQNIKKLGVNIFENCDFNTDITWNRNGKGKNNQQKVLVFFHNRQDIICIPGDISIIGAGVFSGCTKLTEVSIPAKVKIIGKEAFRNCTGLKTIQQQAQPPETTGLERIEDRAFSNCPNLQSFNIIGTPKIGEKVFDRGQHSIVCEGALYFSPIENETIEIPNGVNEIADGAFADNDNLTNLVIPGTVRRIGSYAFSRTGLTSVEIQPGDNEKKIEGGAFSGCTKLTSVLIPNDITVIGNAAFAGCSNLSYFRQNQQQDNNYLPQDLIAIGEYAFWGCTALTSLIIQCNVKKIGNNAFSCCSNLIRAIFSPNSSINEIGDSAFSHCTNLSELKPRYCKKENIANIPQSAKTIEKNAFSGCVQLQKIHLPTNIERIGNSAFSGCSNLEYAPVNGNRKNKGRKDLIKIIIQETTTIKKDSFRNCVNLEDVIIPGCVRTIGEGAFCGCLNLKRIVFEGESQLERIEAAAFSGCAILRSWGTEEDGKALFPGTVTRIGLGTFSGCTGLKTIEFLGDNIPEMGYGAFFCCTNLAIPSNLAEGNRNAFRGCAIQSNDTRDDKLTEIGSLFKTNEIFKSERIVGIIREWMNTSYDWKGKDELFTTLEFNKYSQELREAIDQNRWQLLNEGEIKKKIRIAVENILEWGGINQDEDNALSFIDPIYDAKKSNSEWDPTNQDNVSSWSKIYAAYSPGNKFIYDSRVALSLSYISLQIDAPCFWRIPSSRGVNDPEWKQFQEMCKRNRHNHNMRNQTNPVEETDIQTCYNQYLVLLNALARNKGIIEEYRKLDERIRQAYNAIDYNEHQAIMAHLEKVLFMKKDDILAPFKPAEERLFEDNTEE